MDFKVNYDDTTGQILGFYPDGINYPNGIPDPVIIIDESQWQDCINNHGKYIIQNGQLLLAPPPSDQEQFDNTQNQKVSEIENGYAQTIAAGFQFTIGTSTYTMGWRQDGVYNDQLHLSMTQMAIDKGVETFPIDYADINGNAVSIPDQTTLTALDSKANAFSWNNLKQLRSTIADVRSMSLSNYSDLQKGLDAINSIMWVPATY